MVYERQQVALESFEYAIIAIRCMDRRPLSRRLSLDTMCVSSRRLEHPFGPLFASAPLGFSSNFTGFRATNDCEVSQTSCPESMRVWLRIQLSGRSENHLHCNPIVQHRNGVSANMRQSSSSEHGAARS